MQDAVLIDPPWFPVHAASGGNEIPGNHKGPAAHIGYLAGARHSHLDSGGCSFDKKIMVNKAITPEILAPDIITESR